MQLVKQRDFEHYLCCLLLPAGVREKLFAVRAFNVELALVRDQIQRYSGTAEIYRLQFWKDAVEAIYGNGKGPLPRQPVVDALRRYASDVSGSRLRDLVSARQATLGDRPFADVERLCAYGRLTHGHLLAIAADSISTNGAADQSSIKSAACDALGAALAIGYHLRATAPLVRRGIVLAPQDLMQKHMVRPDDLCRAETSPKFVPVVHDLVVDAHTKLTTAASNINQLEAPLRRAFLPLVLVRSVLGRIEKLNCDVFDPKLQLSFPLVPAQLKWRSVVNRY